MSRSIDWVLELELYEQAGVAAYWVVDPAVPSVTAWQLEDGYYGEPWSWRVPTCWRWISPSPSG